MAVVIIPAYKPDRALLDVTNQLWMHGCQIVVVDDGSGKQYDSIFDSISDICIVLHHAINQGKGAAIKTALRYIRQEMWADEEIGVMDADGQHLPEDMMKLLEAADFHRNALILGVRRVGREMPWKSRLGNQITRGMFRLVSGVWVSDTQTGLRAFDSVLLEPMLQVKGERYEYEMNVLMTAARDEIPIREVPIQTIYRDMENTTSHFRLVKDSFRIYKDILKFSLSSLSSFLLDYLLFLVLVHLFPAGNVMTLAANTLARFVSAFYNYSMNCRYVFHRKRKARTAADYFILAAAVLVLNNLILGALARTLPVQMAKLITECILFVFSWTVQRYVIFRKNGFQTGGKEGTEL